MLTFTCIDQSFSAVLYIYPVLRTKMPLSCCISAVHTFCDGNIFDVLTEYILIYFPMELFLLSPFNFILFNSSIPLPFYLFFLYAAKYILNTLGLQTLVAMMKTVSSVVGKTV